MIDYVKQYIGGTDVWIPSDVENGYVMLSVEGSAEYLYSKDDNGYRVCKRYTNASGKNVYEMYHYQNQEVAGSITKTLYLTLVVCLLQ